MSFIRAGSLGSKLARPIMELTYTCSIYRVRKDKDAMGSLKEIYNLRPGAVPCDIMPMTDVNIFAQAGEQEKVTQIMHFFSGTDIRQSDVVRILTSKKLSGIINALYEIDLRLEPSESISYIRCHAKFGTAATEKIKL